jgi:AcrR family transcriptional regulator
MTHAAAADGRGRRVGSATSERRAHIVEATERLMYEQGYASLTYRSVAASAGVTAGLVQYYFPTLDELVVAVLEHGTERVLADIDRAFASDQPLRALWAYASNPTGAALIVEFMAAGNHRKQIWDKIGEGGERIRRAQLAALQEVWDRYGIDDREMPPAALLFLMTAIGRVARLEESFGTRTGHKEAIALVERLLDRVEPQVRRAPKRKTAK